MSALSRLRAWGAPLLPGVMLSATIAAAAAFLGAHYGAPVMLFALLLGMAFNFLHEDGPCRAGVEFSAKFILRLGVGLLGIRIAFDDLAQIGVQGAGLLIGLIALTIAAGFLAAPLFRRQWRFALLTGGAVAICGASAALAIAAVIPHNDKTERNTLFTVMAVTALSTIAMVVYPLLFQGLGFSEVQQGFLIGATIHDVAQVVGAGFSVSDTAGEMATITKLFRVAMLPVVLIAIVLVLRVAGPGAGQGKIPLLPWFMVLFLALVALGSAVDLPGALVAQVDTVSRACLITAIAALGVKTSLRALTAVGGGHLAIVVIETLALLALASTALYAFAIL
ncbi:YeiH family protein [Roseinatronobacter monicus]|uniref:Putative integral membrane protein (TIGR00698 family) n=1 Tax=Roseinatronobacter monicus TaxID=393481 RepID=A0A543KAQ3_9RHOB|nr:putative sulfate exporter family transporter [Roseinatronobacter monicus]TQM92161.1 putative integral membrane protein (TIGR00698 family) [Roseinatronobacter monicus]